MAGIAIYHRVSADQGKAILVFVDVVHGDFPTISGVAQFALGSVFAAMQIRMAVLALVRGVGEPEVVVAVAAAHGSMTAAKGKSSVRMIEPDPVREELPVRGCVAGDARNVEVAMRALR